MDGAIPLAIAVAREIICEFAVPVIIVVIIGVSAYGRRQADVAQGRAAGVGTGIKRNREIAGVIIALAIAIAAGLVVAAIYRLAPAVAIASVVSAANLVAVPRTAPVA